MKVKDLSNETKTQYDKLREAWIIFVRAEEKVQNGSFMKHYRKFRAKIGIHPKATQIQAVHTSPAEIKTAIETIRQAVEQSPVSTPQEEYILQERTKPIMDLIDDYERDTNIESTSSSEGQDIQDDILSDMDMHTDSGQSDIWNEEYPDNEDTEILLEMGELRLENLYEK
mgnify:FL=1